ncbi:MAG: FliM/FliN family flagellar motor switch protein [Oscillospiraceae bacterium]|nr:FliM/FliN family flagellar motor switch protein [Oscillospiraceae bacterium]
MAMSQKQIDELLKDKKNIQATEEQPQIPGKEQKPQKKSSIKPYNFLAPQRYQKEQIKMLDNVFDNFARFVGSQLTSMLRISCSAKIVGITETKFRDYNAQVGDSSLIGIIEFESPENWLDRKLELMLIERPISFAILDYLLGGDGSCYNIEREYTEIEMDILENVIRQFAPPKNNIWNNYAPDMKRNLQMIETNLRMIQSIPADETIVVLDLELEIKGLHGMLQLVFPSPTMDAFLNIFSSKVSSVKKTAEDDELVARKRNILESIKDTPLTVTGVLGTTEIHVQELLELQPGDIFLLNDANREQSVRIKVEDEVWFKGKIGVHKKNYAVKVTETLNHK